MTTWSFTLRLNRAPTDDELDALYEAGLDDAAPEGDLLHVDRDSETLVEAAWSAARQVSAVPELFAVRLERGDATTLRDIAQRLDRTYESVRLLAEGKRGPGEFPAPRLDTSAGRVWSWDDVAGWVGTNYPDLGVEAAADDHRIRAADAVIRLAASLLEASEADRRRITAVLREVEVA